MSVRAAELYLTRDIITALHLIKVEGESPESIAEKFLTERLKADYPGIFDIITEMNATFDTARADNQKRVNEWKQTLKKL
jgi:hypothetical protein